MARVVRGNVRKSLKCGQTITALLKDFFPCHPLILAAHLEGVFAISPFTPPFPGSIHFAIKMTNGNRFSIGTDNGGFGNQDEGRVFISQDVAIGYYQLLRAPSNCYSIFVVTTLYCFCCRDIDDFFVFLFDEKRLLKLLY